MSWRRATLLALYIVLAAACSAGNRNASSQEPVSVAPDSALDPTPLAGAVVVNDANRPAARWGDDRWELAGTAAPVLADDALTLVVSYSGGCARHDFTLVADSRFEASDPPRLVLFLVHDANGDRCEAYPTEAYRFDLAPVRALYERAYGRGGGVVRLLLRGPDPPRTVADLTYDFQASP